MENIADFLNEAEKDPILLFVHVEETNKYLADIFSSLSIEVVSDNIVDDLVTTLSYSSKLNHLLFVAGDKARSLHDQKIPQYLGCKLSEIIKNITLLDKDKRFYLNSYDIDHMVLSLIEKSLLSKEKTITLLDFEIDRVKWLLGLSNQKIDEWFKKYISLTKSEVEQDINKQLDFLYKCMQKRQSISA